MKQFRRHVVVLAAIVLIGISPLIPVLVSALIAAATGCQVDEGGPRPCIVLGVDLGRILSEMLVLGWLGLATIPTAGILLVAWAVWAGATLLRTLVKR